MEEKKLLNDISRITEPFDLVAALTYMRENGEFIRCKSEGEDFYMYREVQKRPVIKEGRRQLMEVETVGALTQWGATVPTMNLSELFHKNFYIMQFDEKGNPDWSEPHRKENAS